MYSASIITIKIKIMNSDISLARFKQFPVLMWIFLFGSFITRGSYYMVWPFLAVILYEKFALSATEVGLVLTSAAVISVFTSFIGSSLSDKVGRHTLMYITGVLYIISFSLLAEVETVAGYVIVMTLCSIATALWRCFVLWFRICFSTTRWWFNFRLLRWPNLILCSGRALPCGDLLIRHTRKVTQTRFCKPKLVTLK